MKKNADANDVARDHGADELRRRGDEAWARGRAANGHQRGEGARAFHATPFVWRAPESIPPREWLYGRHLIRLFVSCTIAAGGVGKSTLTIADALAMCCGRNVTGDKLTERLRVWYINIEDPEEELDRRIIAAMLHHGIDPSEVQGRLFRDSGRGRSLCIARAIRGEIEFDQPLIDFLKDEIRRNKIDVVIIDPFVLIHRIPESDNGMIAAVGRCFAEIAEETNSAIDLVHHTRKAAAGQTEKTAEDARGAGALINSVRTARICNPMTEDEASKAGVPDGERWRYFRLDDAKRNLAPPAASARWRRFVSVGLGNGTSDYPEDDVGVVAAWEWPDPLAGLTATHLLAVQRAIDGKNYRQNPQAAKWIGIPVAHVLGLNPQDKAHRQRIGAALSLWLKSGALVIGETLDEKRMPRPIIEVGKWAV